VTTTFRAVKTRRGDSGVDLQHLTHHVAQQLACGEGAARHPPIIDIGASENQYDGSAARGLHHRSYVAVAQKSGEIVGEGRRVAPAAG
jgi:hypothetical protein